MSYLLFIDECGHDHRHLPYGARGGICLPDDKVWEFTCKMRDLEYQCFGCHLHEYDTELKARHLLEKNRFEWAAYFEKIPSYERRQLCAQFLRQDKKTRRHFCAFGQASLKFVRHLISLLVSSQARIFASLIPQESLEKTGHAPGHHMRSDILILFERYGYFLEDRNSMGLIALDEGDRTDDRRFLRKMEAFFRLHEKGKIYADWMIPTPFFVGSDLSYPLQAADIIIYCLVQCHRQPSIGMDAPVRPEIAQLVDANGFGRLNLPVQARNRWHASFPRKRVLRREALGRTEEKGGTKKEGKPDRRGL